MKHSVDVEIKASLEEGVNSLAKEFKRYNDRKRNSTIISGIYSACVIGIWCFVIFKPSKSDKKSSEEICDKNPEDEREEIKEELNQKEEQ